LASAPDLLTLVSTNTGSVKDFRLPPFVTEFREEQLADVSSISELGAAEAVIDY
jgi:hypothetical protein